MPLQATRSALHAYVPATLRKGHLKAALSVIIDAEPQPSDQKCLEIPNKKSKRIFHSEIFSGP